MNHPARTDQESPSPAVAERWALVTGASAGIGAAFCDALAARGYAVALVARREERLREVAKRLRDAHGIATTVIAADLARRGASAAITESLEGRGLVVDVLVNNAGYGVPGRYTTPSWEQHADYLQVMVTAPCELTWRLLPGMQERGRGAIVNVASLAGLTPGTEGHTLYAASKSFLIKFSESLALENARHGVHVSALCPGFTYSEFHDRTGTREQVSRLPGFMWQTADEVVEFGLDRVLRDNPQVVAVPGAVNRFLSGLNRHAPWLARWIVRRQSKNFRKLD